MTAVLIGLFLLMSYNAKIYFKGFNESYLSKDSTAAVKGCFLILVFIRHFSQYITDWNDWDFLFVQLDKSLAQLLVAMFLFYSGYGVALSVRTKGIGYVKRIPKHRFLSVLLQFDIAVLLYLALNLLMGGKFSLKNTLLSLIGWSSLGNSNWYIFSVLILYLITFVSFIFLKDKIVPGAVAVTVLTAALIIVLKQYKDPWWYNTLICYVIGIWYSVFKEQIEKLLSKKSVTEICLLVFTAAFFISRQFMGKRFLCYELSVFLFTVMILLFTRKVRIGNRAVKYLGDHLFSLYILQRIPMMILSRTPLTNYKITFFALSAVVTLALGFVFDKSIGKLVKALKL